MTALVWLTRDLRVHDHPALRAALDRADRVVPVFCLDDRLLSGRNASGPRTQFMLECLADLDERLGGTLVIRRGPPERELTALAREAEAGEVHFSADSGPFARRRIDRVTGTLAEAGVECFAHPGMHAVDDLDELRTQAGKPYTVFSPFHRAWLGAPRRDVLGRPRSFGPLPSGVRKGRLPSLASLGLEQEVEDPLPGGESAARERLSRFLGDGVREYSDNHDALGRNKTSRLSPYLHFGCLSPREVESRLPRGRGADAFRRQLCWRDFYHHVLLHFPGNAHDEFQERYRGELSWSDDEDAFRAWCDGRTGYPLVDAGMRQLRREGWMHNRARLVVGSFLTKDLGIDWRAGERWFMRLLIDGDQANTGGSAPFVRPAAGLPPDYLAMDRVGRRGPAAVLPAHLQPGPAHGAVRSAWRLRPEVRARAARRARRVPARAVDDAGRGAEGGRLRDRRGLSGADRGPPRGARGGVRAVPRLSGVHLDGARLKRGSRHVDDRLMSIEVTNGLPEGLDRTVTLELSLAEAEAVKSWLLKPAADGSAAIDDENAKSVMVKLGAKLDFIEGVARVRDELEAAGFPTDTLTDEQVAELGRRIAESPIRRYSGNPS